MVQNEIEEGVGKMKLPFADASLISEDGDEADRRANSDCHFLKLKFIEMPLVKKNISLFLFCLILSIANGYFFNYINSEYFHYSSDENGLSDFSRFSKFLIIVIIAPIVETAIFNLSPNLVLSKLKTTNILLLIIIPSIIFALFHLYHPIYALMALIGSLIMNGYYIYNLNNRTIAFWSVTILHATYNLYGYLFVN